MVTERKLGFRGDRLKLTRESATPKMSQGALADEMNTRFAFSDENRIKQQHVSTWEVGFYSPNAEYIAMFAQILDVSTDYLLGVVDEPKGRSPVRDDPSLKDLLAEAVLKDNEGEVLEMLTALMKQKNQRGVSEN